MKRIVIIAALAVVAGGAYGAWRAYGPQDQTNPYENVPKEVALRGPFEVTIEEIGVLDAAKSNNIMPPFNGRVAWLLEDGKRVKAGETIAIMDTQQIYDDLMERVSKLRENKLDLENQARTISSSLEGTYLDLQSAAAQLEFNQLRLINVNRELLTLETLFGSELVAQRQVDSKIMQSGQQQLSALTSDLTYTGEHANRETQKKTQTIELDKLKHRADRMVEWIDERRKYLDSAEIKAPIDGIFMLRQRFDGRNRQLVSTQVGDEVDQRNIIAMIPELGSLFIDSQISESSLNDVQVGTPVEVTFDAFAGLKAPGKITTVGFVAMERIMSPAGRLTETDASSGVMKVFNVKASLDNIDERLRPAMTANLSIKVQRLENTLSVPYKCVFSKGGQKVVYLATATGYEARPVALGARNRNRVVVLDGLKDDDQVFTVNLEPDTSQEDEAAEGAKGPSMGMPS